MRSERLRRVLLDIAENIALAEGFVEGMEYEAFAADKRTVYAVTRALEVISEAARRLPEEVRARHPAIPWRDVRDAGNVYRHEYERVLAGRLWTTVRHALPPLAEVVRAELERLGEDAAGRS